MTDQEERKAAWKALVDHYRPLVTSGIRRRCIGLAGEKLKPIPVRREKEKEPEKPVGWYPPAWIVDLESGRRLIVRARSGFGAMELLDDSDGPYFQVQKMQC